jgi:hypothetical protein
MKLGRHLVIAACGGLAACGGVSTQYSQGYRPQDLKFGDPVDVAVIGSPGAGVAQPSIVATVAAELKLLGVNARDAAALRGPASEYRLTVIFGSGAEGVARMANTVDRDGGHSVCATLQGQSGSTVSGTTEAGSAEGTPAVAALCQGGALLGLAQETVGANASGGPNVQGQVGNLVDLVVPASNWRQSSDNTNGGG